MQLQQAPLAPLQNPFLYGDLMPEEDQIDYIGTPAKSQFSYDALGRRTVDVETDAVGNVTTTRFLWCPDSRSLGVGSGSRICQTRNGTDVVQSRVLPEGEYNVITAQKAVYMQDQLGSVRDVIDATTGSLISSLDYSPYGKITQSNGSFSPFYQYAGLMYHPQSTLLLSFTRAFDPLGQHWLNKDLLREWAGSNLYAYVNARSVTFTDGMGLDPLLLPGPPNGTSSFSGSITAGPAPTDITAYRYYGGGASQMGSWLSPIEYPSSEAAIGSLALPPANTAAFMCKVTIPAGTQMQTGIANGILGRDGGGIQIQLLEEIPQSSFQPGVPVPMLGGGGANIFHPNNRAFSHPGDEIEPID